MSKKCLCSFLVSLAVAGCGSSKIGELEQSVSALRRDLGDIRSIQAQQNTKIEEIKTEMRGLTGKVEEVQHTSVGKTQELEQTISKLQSRVPPPAGVPEQLLNQDDERIAPLNGAAADMYRQALSAVRTGDFVVARTTLEQFIEQNPGTAFTDNALFWFGVVNERLNQLDKAVASFSEVFQKYPAEDMVPAALYFLAETLVRMNSKNDAILTLQKLIDEHPKSEFAAQGRARIAQLQPSVRKKR